MASSQLIFMKGKEKALDALFDGSNDKAAFGYLAVGFNEDATTNGMGLWRLKVLLEFL